MTMTATATTVTIAEFIMNVPTPTPQARSNAVKVRLPGRPSGLVKISRRVLKAANSIQAIGIRTKRLHNETTP
jgi:hypothetical protein